MANKRKCREGQTHGGTRNTEQAGKFALEMYFSPKQVDCQTPKQPAESLDEKLDRLWAELETTQTDSEWVEIFLQWIDLHEQKMAVTQ